MILQVTDVEYKGNHTLICESFYGKQNRQQTKQN